MIGSSLRSPSPSSHGLRSALREVPWLSMLTLIAIASLAPVLAFASGCGSRTVFVPEESPMRVGPGAEVRVYHRVDGEWTLSRNKVGIPEGWYLVPPSYVKE